MVMLTTKVSCTTGSSLSFCPLFKICLSSLLTLTSRPGGLQYKSKSTSSDQFSYSLSSDENNLFNQCLISSCSEYIDANNLSDAYEDCYDVGGGNSYEQRAETCYIGCAENNFLVDSELLIFYEGYTVDLSGSNSTDATNTGVLTYSWSIASDNGGPDIELENAANENLSIIMPSLDESNKLRSSTGVAMNWLSPVGPLSFVLATNLSKASTDQTQTFNFNLGTSF